MVKITKTKILSLALAASMVMSSTSAFARGLATADETEIESDSSLTSDVVVDAGDDESSALDEVEIVESESEDDVLVDEEEDLPDSLVVEADEPEDDSEIVDIISNDSEEETDNDVASETDTNETEAVSESENVSESVSETDASASASSTADEHDWVITLASTNGFDVADESDLDNAVSLTITEDEATELAGGVIGGTYHYCGIAITPTYSLYDSTTKTYAVEGTDYTANYYDNINVGIGYVEYVFDIEGSNFYGSDNQYVCFYIVTREVTDDNAEVTGIDDPVTYSGIAYEPEPYIVVDATNNYPVPEKDTDYVLTYLENTNAGTATVTIDFDSGTSGNYSGTLTRTFTIEALALEDGDYTVETIDTQSYTGSQITPEPTITLTDGTVLEKDTDYELTHGENIEAGEGVGTVTITFINNYSGGTAVTFDIESYDLDNDSVTIEAIEDQIYTGSAITPAVTVTVTATGVALIEDTDFTVEYSDNVDVGTASVAITFIDSYSGSASTTFEIVAASVDEASIEVVFSDIADQTYTGSAIEPHPTVAVNAIELTEDEDYTLSWEDNVHVGTATVTAVFIKNYSSTASTTFSIVAKSIDDVDDADISVTVPAEDYIYTGSAIEPTPTVVVEGETLTEGEDYTVSYSDNTDAGEATVTITFIGDYSGETEITFTIQQLELDEDDLTVTGIVDKTYTGSAIEQTIAVAYGKTSFDLDDEYTLSYENNIEVGTATVIITLQGNYTGEVTKTFEITAASAADAIADGTIEISTIADQTYTGSAIEPTVTVTENGSTLTEGTDYTVTYGNNTDVTDSAYALVTFIKNYSGEQYVYFAIVAKAATEQNTVISGIDENYTYTGSAIEPTVSITVDGLTLTGGTDFDVEYSNNTNVGTATVTITYKGNYSGTATETFTIEAETTDAAIEDGTLVVSDIDDQEYTGSAITPEVSVTADGTVLEPGTDYTVTYSDNTNAGAATATVEFIKNYSGSVVKNFTITAKDISEGPFTIYGNGDQKYTGETLTPELTNIYNTSVVLVGGSEGDEGIDYWLEYTNNVNVGDATITVHFVNNYTGTTITTFAITQDAVDTTAVTVSDIADQTYTGSAITPEPIVIYNTKQLTLNTDYKLVYTGNTDVGTATITINFINNYSGSTAATFSIVAKDASAATISDIDAEYEYTGDAISPVPTVTLTDYGTLIADTDYDVVYTNNTDAGTATATVNFKDNFSGSISTTFTITQKSADDAIAEGIIEVADITDQTYTGSAITPDVTVTADGVALTSGTDYTVTYSNNVNAGTATASITFIKNYSGTVTKDFTIVAYTLDTDSVKFSDVNASYTYTGSEIEPTPTIIYGSTVLTEGTDYTLAYTDNTDIGTATIAVTFIGNYAGTAEKTFEITAMALSNATIEIDAIADQTYTGSAIEPELTITVDGTVLVADQDYTVEYTDNTDVGTASVAITFTGNYSGTGSTTFEIVSKVLTILDLTFSGIESSYSYTGAQIAPTPTITLADGTVLEEGIDYELSYGDNKEVGQGTVEITFIGNYSGTAEKTFGITTVTLTEDNVTIGEIEELTFSGSEQTPEPDIYLNGVLLELGVDYTLSYSNNVNASTATITITGMGGCTGSVDGSFTINPRKATFFIIIVGDSIWD